MFTGFQKRIQRKFKQKGKTKKKRVAMVKIAFCRIPLPLGNNKRSITSINPTENIVVKNAFKN